MVHDSKLLELRDEIAMTDARITDVLQRVDTGESGMLWCQGQAAMRRFAREQAKGNVDGMQRALVQVQRLLTQGADDEAAWRQVGELIEQRRRLCESEHRRLIQAHDMISAEQAMVLLAQVVEAIQRHVQDKAILAAIAQEFQALGHHNGNGHE